MTDRKLRHGKSAVSEGSAVTREATGEWKQYVTL